MGGGGEGWMRTGVGREEAKAPQVNQRGPELPTDGPDHTGISPVKGRIPGR